VRDEEIGEAEIALQLLQKIHDLRADADVESGNRLIGDDELRPQGESAGNADALALASGKLVRITGMADSSIPTARKSSRTRWRRHRG
jgi:hypothetical protein